MKKTTYTILRKCGVWGWTDTRYRIEDIGTLEEAKKFISMSVNSGWEKKNHRLIKVETTEVKIA